MAAHFERYGDHFAVGQILESTRVVGAGKAGPEAARDRRVVYQYLSARRRRDDRAINAMVDRAEKVAAGTRPAKKDGSCASGPAPPATPWTGAWSPAPASSPA